jgi:hypothetical protein
LTESPSIAAGDAPSTIVEERSGGILLRPAVATPVRIYTTEEKAQFLLNNAVDEKDYERARDAVRDDLGLNPDKVPHLRPDGLRATRRR